MEGLAERKIPRILVVDDTKAIRDILSKILSFMGYEVVVASSGNEGLNRFLKHSFELVLTDFNMPGIDGYTLALRIKDKSPNTPVVLITGSEEEVVMERLKGCCVDCVMFKPFHLDEIEEIVHRMIDEKPSGSGSPPLVEASLCTLP
jgi:two-component system capsular synthesis sensor histidine kinase RcsC